jgi:hypothetical protein
MQEDGGKPVQAKYGFVTKSMGLNMLFHNEFDQALDDEAFVQAYWRTTTHIVHAPCTPNVLRLLD